MRLKIAHTLGNRDETTDKDERILNAVAESQGGRRKEDRSLVQKRPGTTSRYTLAVGQFTTSTFGQALFVVNFPSAPGATGTTAPRLVGIRGDKLKSPVS